MAENNTNLINTRVQLRHDTSANWNAATTARLLPGEIGIETDTGLFKIGKADKDDASLGALWQDLRYANDLSTVTNKVKIAASYEDLGNGIVIGDIGIVKEVIYDGEGTNNDKYSHTAYVWNGSAWEAMDGNYSAENVYFDSNLTITANIGVQSLGSDTSKELNTQGKSLKQVLNMILAKEEPPTITSNPSVTTQISNSTTANPANSNITVEGGTTINPRWNASLSAGSYKYGPATGITAKSWAVDGYLNGSKVSGHSATSASTQNFSAITLAAGDSYKVNAAATYDNGAIANTNLQEPYQAGNALFDATPDAAIVRIAGTTKNDDSPTITAWQQGYYIGTLESDVAVTSNILRNTDDGKGVLKNRFVRGANYSGTTKTPETLKFEAGQKGAFTGTMAKFVVAYPSSIDKNADGTFKSDRGLTKFFNNSSFEEYVKNFTKSTLIVAGADNDLASSHAKEYTVCTWTPSAAFSGETKFEVVLS